MITTDIAVIGAGPVALFQIFEAGLLKLRCHLIDYLPQAGGQLSSSSPGQVTDSVSCFSRVSSGTWQVPDETRKKQREGSFFYYDSDIIWNPDHMV